MGDAAWLGPAACGAFFSHTNNCTHGCKRRHFPSTGHHTVKIPLNCVFRQMVALLCLLAPFASHGEPTVGAQDPEGSTGGGSSWMTECAPVFDPSEKNEETIRFEHCLRKFRLQRLATQSGVTPPSINELELSPEELPDLLHVVPSLRLSWASATFFEFDEDQATSDVLPMLDLIADAIRRDIGDVHLYVVGHTDAIGDPDYNQYLSMRRARGVLEWLRDAGVPSNRMTYTGMGPSQPVASNLTEEGRALNRRVEFMVSAYVDVNHLLVRNRPVEASWLEVPAAEGVRRTIPRNSVYAVRSLDTATPYKIYELPPPNKAVFFSVDGADR